MDWLLFFRLVFLKKRIVRGEERGKNRVKAGMLPEGDSGKGLLSQTRCDSETECSQIPAPEHRADRQHGNRDGLLLGRC